MRFIKIPIKIYYIFLLCFNKSKNIAFHLLVGVTLLHLNSLAQIPDTSHLGLLIDSAYKMLNINVSEAESLFEKAVLVEPDNITLQNQLGYIYHSQQKYEKAIEHFKISDNLHPSDTIKLQIAFDLILMNRFKEAEEMLNCLALSNLPDIREAAINQIKVLPAHSEAKKCWNRIYLSPYYDTRWKTTIYYGNMESGYYLTDNRLVSAYGFLLASGDARSRGGFSPSIFSDNALIVGLGIKFEPLFGLQFKIQQGLAFDLLKIGENRIKKGDFRAIAIYNNGLYPSLNYHRDVKVPLSPLLDVYSSLGYYSRYDNGIWYLQTRCGARFFEVNYTAMDIFIKGSIARDTRKEFYNNLIEGGTGFRIIPNVNWGLYFVGEYQRGYYWDVGTTPNPYDKYYNSFRFFIIFDKVF